MRALLFPTAGDAREESPAEETRHAEDVYGMSNLDLDTLMQLKVSVVILALDRSLWPRLIIFTIQL